MYMVEVKVENIVASTIFAEKLDLDVITRAIPRTSLQIKKSKNSHATLQKRKI